MKKNRANTSYTNLNQSELAIFAGKVAQAITDNPNFESPRPSVVEFQALADDYKTKLQVSVNGGSLNDKDLKDESKVKLLAGISLLAQYVNSVADGNLAIISSSALIAGKQAVPKGKPGTVINVSMRDGMASGEVNIMFAPQKAAAEYHVQIGKTVAGNDAIAWGEQFIAPHSNSYIIPGLEPGVRYYARVRAHNSKGTGDWSEYVSLIVR